MLLILLRSMNCYRGETAALRVVVGGYPMLRQRLVLHIPIEIVRDAVAVLLKPHAHVRVEVLRLTYGVLAKAVWTEAHIAPIRVVRQTFLFPSGVGAEASEAAVPSVVMVLNVPVTPPNGDVRTSTCTGVKCEVGSMLRDRVCGSARIESALVLYVRRIDA